AIFNDTGASLSVLDSSLTDNQATTAVSFDPSTGGGGGGAIFNNFGASLNVTDSQLSDNQAVTTVGFDNFRGAIYNLGGTARLSGCTLADNQVTGAGSSTIFGGSSGGAIANDIGAMLTVADSSFIHNQAICANGGYFSYGGAIDNEAASSADIKNSRFTNNQSHRGDGTGPFAGRYRGALSHGPAVRGRTVPGID